MSDSSTITRRRFMQATATTTALALGSGKMVNASPQEKAEEKKFDGKVLNFGVIGLGGRGRSLMDDLLKRGEEKGDVKVVAICDIYERRKNQVRDKAKDATVYHEHENLLKHPNLDCVVIATPDHWHAQMAIDACKAGKDVYVEKPMTHTIEEAKELAKVVEKTNRILQVGSQHMSEDVYWQAKKAVEKGLIGKVVWSQSSYSRNSVGGEWNYPILENAEKSIDWERYLGPAPKRPWDPERYFRFRKFWDYSGGIATDLFYHKLAPMAFLTGSGFPCRVSAGGGIFVHPDREVPDTYMTMIDYPNKHTIVLAASMANRQGLPEVVRGHRGTITFGGGGVIVTPENEYVEEYMSEIGGEKYRAGQIVIPSQEREDHMSNFISCVRSRQQPHFDVRFGYMVQVAITLGVRAYRENKVFNFDPEKEKII